MRLPQTGGCQCGRLRYEIDRAPFVVYACHCVDCQRTTSSAFSMAVVVPDQSFRMVGITPRLINRATDSGRISNRWVCPDCGSWICSGPRPGSSPAGINRAVRAGTLDDTSWLRPTIHFYTRNKQPWVVLPADGHLFETQPPDLAAYLTSVAASAVRST
jgi:hypothetical protein